MDPDSLFLFVYLTLSDRRQVVEFPFFVCSCGIEITLAVLPGFVPFQQHIEDLVIVFTGAVQAEAKLAIDLVHVDAVGLLQIEQQVYETCGLLQAESIEAPQ